MNYFLAPRSGERSYKNFQSTIRHGVAWEKIKDHLNDEGRRLIGQEEIIYAWANRAGTKKQWERMQPGDRVIFYSHGDLVLVGEVYFKQHSPELALAMWPLDENNKPWEYTFFIKNLSPVKIPMVAFNAMAGYKSNFVVQGFTYLGPDRIALIDQHYGSMERLLQSFGSTESPEIVKADEKLNVHITNEVHIRLRENAVITPLEPVAPKASGRSVKVDYIKKAKTSALTGSKGEAVVIEFEKTRLRDAGRNDLAERIVQTSLDDDSAGFDIRSFDEDGTERFIEVKSTAPKTDDIRFFLTAKEKAQAELLKNYYIYFVDGATTNSPRITPIPNPLQGEKFLMQPSQYLLEAKVS